MRPMTKAIRRIMALGLSTAILLASAGAYAQSDSFSSSGGVSSAPATGGYYGAMGGFATGGTCTNPYGCAHPSAPTGKQAIDVPPGYIMLPGGQMVTQQRYHQMTIPPAYNPAYGRPSSPMYNPAFGRPNGFSPQRAPYNIPFYGHPSAEQQALAAARGNLGIRQLSDFMSFLGNVKNENYGSLLYQQLAKPQGAY